MRRTILVLLAVTCLASDARAAQPVGYPAVLAASERGEIGHLVASLGATARRGYFAQ